jgi:hypothetical protein
MVSKNMRGIQPGDGVWHFRPSGLSASPAPAGARLARYSGHTQRKQEAIMDLYIIRRRGVWANEQELQTTNEKSAQVGEDMAERLRWIRSYAVTEEDGRIGSVCIYDARNPGAIREHGRRIGAPSEDFQVVRGAVVKRPDPQSIRSG